MRSPSLINAGALISIPFSSVMGRKLLVTVAFFISGGAMVTFNVTV